MKYNSSLPIEEVSSILKEQVQPIMWRDRIFFLKRSTSRVCGKVSGNHIKIMCTNDPFSKWLIGELKENKKSTILEAKWQAGFWSNLYGFHKSNEEIIELFLKEWARLNKTQ